jgi:hypothetical protein
MRAHARFAFGWSVLLFAAAACGESSSATAPTSTPTSGTSTSLVFVVDPGVRIANAAIPAAGLDASGVTYLYYEDTILRRQRVATSTDGLSFGAGSDQTNSNRTADPRRTRLPDGTWRLYQWNNAGRTMGSFRSADGVSFTAETGVRYAPTADDHNTVGVYEAFTESSQVVLLYLGDLMGLNNLRRAVSTDNGVTFTFDRGNVLGDSSLGGGAQSFVDPESLPLPDGRRRLFVMKQGSIYSFISAGSSQSFTQESGTHLTPASITQASVQTLYDPSPVQLPDGRFRIYVAAGSASGTSIYSATSVR